MVKKRLRVFREHEEEILRGMRGMVMGSYRISPMLMKCSSLSNDVQYIKSRNNRDKSIILIPFLIVNLTSLTY